MYIHENRIITMMNSFWYLQNADLYKILCPHKLKEYTSRHFQEFKKGDFIYMENDHADKVYLVGRGKVKIVHYREEGTEMIIAILNKGELFGEKAILGEQKREDAAVSCTNDTLICPLDRETMYTLMRDDQRFSLTIYKILGFRLKKLERRLERLFFKDTRARIIEFVNDLIDYESGEPDSGMEIPHTYTQKDIADLIGATRETVTKELIKLKSEGILFYQRKHIKIVDIDLYRTLLEK